MPLSAAQPATGLRCHERAAAADNVEIADLHHTGWPREGYDPLRFGFEKYAGPVSDAWYDDIAAGTGPLGCN